MNIAFLGYGQVGAPLADHLQRLGHNVTLAAQDRHSTSAQSAVARNPGLHVAAPQDAVRAAEIVFLATPFHANETALRSVASEIRGKILVDCTNPVGRNLSHGLNNVQAGSQFVQSLVPDTRVVKAFTIYGYENFEDNSYPAFNVKPVMLYCGDDSTAKQVVGGLIAELGWEPLDVGGLDQALHLEHLTLLWVKLVRGQGRSPHTVWAMLTR